MNENPTNHSLYNQWLLNDEFLSAEQFQLVKDHVRNCAECRSLSHANLLLRSSGVIRPAEGFTERFKFQLAAQNKIARQRSITGVLLLVLVSVVLIVILLLPFLPYLVLTPAQLTDIWFKNMVYAAQNARVFGAVLNTILPVLASIIPAYIWIFTLLVIGSLVPLWAFSISRIGKSMYSVLEV